MVEPSGTDPKTITDLWTAIWGGVATALALGLTAAVQYLWKRREAFEKPIEYELAQAEIADMRPARRLVNELGPKLETMFSKIDLILERSDGRDLRIADLAKDHRELLEKVEEVLGLLRDMERQSDRDRAVREDRERRMDRGI